MKQKIIFFILFSCCAFGESYIQFSMGSTNFVGDLSDKTVFSKSLQFRLLHYQYENKKYYSFISIDTIEQKVVQTKNEFPFGLNAKVSNLNFLFIINSCMKLGKNWSQCLGIGQGTVNVNSKTIRRDYGSWNYQYLLDYKISKKWITTLMIKYVGKVEQKNFDNESSFAFWGPYLGLTYRL